MPEVLDPAEPAFCDATAKLLARNLADMAEMECAISSLYPADGSSVPSEAVVALQTLDRMQQQVVDLVAVFEQLANGEHSVTELLSRVKLAQTHILFAPQDPSRFSASGDVDVF